MRRIFGTLIKVIGGVLLITFLLNVNLALFEAGPLGKLFSSIPYYNTISKKDYHAHASSEIDRSVSMRHYDTSYGQGEHLAFRLRFSSSDHRDSFDSVTIQTNVGLMKYPKDGGEVAQESKQDGDCFWSNRANDTIYITVTFYGGDPELFPYDVPDELVVHDIQARRCGGSEVVDLTPYLEQDSFKALPIVVRPQETR